ncbi:hypothetical protein [uncultured Tateyamaria sp.]|uniref:hypothetical protein n=1 Tax=uncultured Tateyamaria sp. TaxID=455651 RepID=UPI00263319F5|nr:hypothetical protein [uncultured Tateyamaria sp.]
MTFSKANGKPHGMFSPLYSCDVTFDGVTLPSAEHAFQYGKPKRAEVRDWKIGDHDEKGYNPLGQILIDARAAPREAT